MARNPSGVTLLLRSIFGVGGEDSIRIDLSHSENMESSVRINYKNRQTGARERVVDVYSIGNGYIDAYDHFRKEVRTFKIGRIQWTESTNEKFKRVPDYSPSGWVESGWGEFGN